MSQATASRPFSVSQSRSSKASPKVQCELCRSLPEGQVVTWAGDHQPRLREMGGGQSWRAKSRKVLQASEQHRAVEGAGPGCRQPGKTDRCWEPEAA